MLSGLDPMRYRTRERDTRLILDTRTTLTMLRIRHPTAPTEATQATRRTWLRLRLRRPSRAPTPPGDPRHLHTRNTHLRRLLVLHLTAPLRRVTRLSLTAAIHRVATVVPVTRILATPARATLATAVLLLMATIPDGKRAVTPVTLATPAPTLAPIPATLAQSTSERTPALLILELILALLIPAPTPGLTLVRTLALSIPAPTPARWTLVLTRALSTPGTRELLTLVTPALSTLVTLALSTTAILELLILATLVPSTPATLGLTPEWILVTLAMLAWTLATCVSTLATRAPLILGTCVPWTPETPVLTPGILVQTLATTPGWIPATCVARTLGMSELLLLVPATRATCESFRGTPETWALASSITARTTCAIRAIYLPTLLGPIPGRLIQGRWTPGWRTPGRSTLGTCVTLAMFVTHGTCATLETCATPEICETRGTFVTLAWILATWTRMLARRRPLTTRPRAAVLVPRFPLVHRHTTFVGGRWQDRRRPATTTIARVSRATCVFSR